MVAAMERKGYGDNSIAGLGVLSLLSFKAKSKIKKKTAV